MRMYCNLVWFIGITLNFLNVGLAASPKLIVRIEGNDAAKIEKQIRSYVPSYITIESESLLLNALRTSNFDNAINQSSSRGSLTERITEFGQQKNIHLVILGKVISGSKIWMYVVNTLNGDVEMDRSVSYTKKLKKRRRKRKSARLDTRQIGNALRPIFDSINNQLRNQSGPSTSGGGQDQQEQGGGWDNNEWGSPGWADGDNKQSSSSRDDSEKSLRVSKHRKKGKAGNEFVKLGAVFTSAGRFLSWKNEKPDRLKRYSAKFAPFPGFEADIFPGAFTRTAGLRDIGLRFGYAMALGLKSSPKNDANAAKETYSTTWSRLNVAAMYRLNLSDNFYQITPRIGFQKLKFDVNIPKASVYASRVPAIDYQNIVVGSDFRLNVTSDIGILLGVGYTRVLNTGQLQSIEYFPKSSAWGIDANVGFTYRVVPNLDLMVGYEYTRFFHKFDKHPTIVTIYQANAANDDYSGIRLGAIFVY